MAASAALIAGGASILRALALDLLTAALAASGPPSAPAAAKPNVVLVLTDDQDDGTVARMPNVTDLVVRKGATFAHAYYNDPTCSPSRATILTGLYDHNTGVTTNNDHKVFYRSGLPARTVAVALRAAGYRTALVGKYFNGYPYPAPLTYVPRGWDRWFARIGGTAAEFGYRQNDDGKVVSFGDAPSDYATDVYRGEAVAFVRQAARDGAPFFLELAAHAPHKPATPAPRDANLFPTLQAPRVPSFDEADVSDKPAYVRDLTRFAPANVDGLYRTRVRSLQAVDDAVGAIVDALAAAGQLANTYLVFTSDNGYVLGPHRIRGEKSTPYEESVRMPLHVRGPGVAAGAVLDHLVGNVDLAPTIAGWAGASLPGPVDGRSFAGLLRPGAPKAGAWRQAYPLNQVARDRVPSWRGVRTRQYTYVEYATGEKELYDDEKDPYQLENKAGSAAPALLAKLRKLTAALAACDGAGCRTLEDAPL